MRRNGTLGGSSDGAGNGSSSSGNMNGRTTTAGGGSGHKIAYDPMDLETRSEEAELPKLTLMEEIILLGIKEWVDLLVTISCHKLTMLSRLLQ